MLHRALFVLIIVPFWSNPWAQEQLSTEKRPRREMRKWTPGSASLMVNKNMRIIHDSLTWIELSDTSSFPHLLPRGASYWSFSRLGRGQQHQCFQRCCYCVVGVQRMNIITSFSLSEYFLRAFICGCRLELCILRPYLGDTAQKGLDNNKNWASITQWSCMCDCHMWMSS